MENKEIMNELFKHIENHEMDQARNMLADDFVFEGPMPEPQGKEQFITSHNNLVNATSNFKYNQSNLREDGNKVIGEIHISGQNTGALDLGFIDGPVVDPTGKEIELARDEFEATIENGKIKSLKSNPHPGGGLKGYLEAIGAELPTQAQPRAEVEEHQH